MLLTWIKTLSIQDLHTHPFKNPALWPRFHTFRRSRATLAFDQKVSLQNIMVMTSEEET